MTPIQIKGCLRVPFENEETSYPLELLAKDDDNWNPGQKQMWWRCIGLLK